jgi:hypothetical protein
MNIHDEARTVEALNTRLINENNRLNKEVSRYRNGIATAIDACIDADLNDPLWIDNQTTMQAHLEALLQVRPEDRGEVPLFKAV